MPVLCMCTYVSAKAARSQASIGLQALMQQQHVLEALADKINMAAAPSAAAAVRGRSAAGSGVLEPDADELLGA